MNTVLAESRMPDSTSSRAAPTRKRLCTHCRLPIPSGKWSWAEEGFCCAGCATAYRVITAAGLGDYYLLAGDERLNPVVEDGGSEKYAWFDHPDFLNAYAQVREDGRYTIRMGLAGIHCAACVWLLEKLPHLVPGVLGSRVDWARATIDIEWQAARVPLSRIATVLSELGYPAYPIQAESANENRRRETREQLVRLAVAGAAAGNNMLIAAALYLGMFAGMAGSIEHLLRISSALIGVISLAWPGRIFLTGAIAALRTKTPHMDLPLALGLFAGTVGSVVNAVRGVGDIYFDSISVLIFVLLLGRWIQSRQQRTSAEAIELLNRLTPRWAQRISGDQAVQVPIALLREGDIVQVRAEDTVPVDGIVRAGRGSVDESILTGESAPVDKQVGDSVVAGSQNLSATIRIEATAVGTQTRIGRIAELVEDAARRKPKIVQWADKVGGYFVVAVLIIAFATFGFWLWAKPTVAVDHVVALLIVACPCALAMATPLAIAVALARAAHHRILIKGGDVLQRLSGTGKIWLDKTGTLTRGQMQLMCWYGETAVRSLVAAIQAHSAHPIAAAMTRGLRSSATANAGDEPHVDDIQQTAWGGISARSTGRPVHIGNRVFVESQGVRDFDAWDRQIAQILSEGWTPVYVAFDRKLVAVAGVGDPIRDEARSALDQIRRLGWSVGILSGDHREIVAGVARQLAIPADMALGELVPEDKVRLVRGGEPGETVVLVGDGVNDSAALAAASVGIAVRRGAEASLAAAPVYLAREGLGDLAHLIRLARTTMRTIRWNFVASIGYNVLAIGLAATGNISPLLAAVLMPISSLTVVSISLFMPRDWAEVTTERTP